MPYTTEQIQSILQPENFTHFEHCECKILKFQQHGIQEEEEEKKKNRACYKKHLLMIKSTENFGNFGLVVLSTQLHEEMHWLFLIMTKVLLRD